MDQVRGNSWRARKSTVNDSSREKSFKAKDVCSGCKQPELSKAVTLFGLSTEMVTVYYLCRFCSGKASKRARKNARGEYQNTKWIKKNEESKKDDSCRRVAPLWELALRQIVVGIMNRSEVFNAERMSGTLRGVEKEQLIDVIFVLNKIESKEFAALIKDIGWSDEERSIREMNLENMKIRVNELLLLEYFCKGVQVDILKLAMNNFGPQGAKMLEQILENDTVIYLDVSWNKIGSGNGILSIARCIPNSLHLKTLNLSANSLGPIGAKHVAAVLVKNTSLEVLNMAFNDILAEGAVCLGQALHRNSTLLVLNIRSNRIGPQGCAGVVDALRVNRTIKKVLVCDNQIGAEAAADFASFYRGTITDLTECISGGGT